MMNRINPPDIPRSVGEFAKGVAALAKENDIDRFEVKLRVARPHRGQWSGELRIIGSFTDGRGRPCENLRLELDTLLREDIVSNAETTN